MLCDMKKRTLILLLVLAIILIAAIVAYALTRQPLDTTGSNASESTQGTPTPVSGEGPSPAISDGMYVDYSPTAIANADGVVLLFFHATWCPSCRQIESEITSEGVPGGVTIIKVDYDSHQDLRQEYGVTIQTTFVKVDGSGNEITKFVPYGGDLGLDLVLDELT